MVVLIVDEVEIFFFFSFISWGNEAYAIVFSPCSPIIDFEYFA